MAWVRIDDQFADHPKIKFVGKIGMAIQIEALCYCNRYLTDGFVSFAVAKNIVSDKRWHAKMVDAGLWEMAEGGYLLHDYLEFNPSKAEVLAKREKLSNAAKLGAKSTNEKRWQSPNASPLWRPSGDANGDTNIVAPTPVPNPKQTEPPDIPNGIPPPRKRGGEPPPELIAAVEIWNQNKTAAWPSCLKITKPLPHRFTEANKDAPIDLLEVMNRAKASSFLSEGKFVNLLWIYSRSEKTGNLHFVDILDGRYDNRTNSASNGQFKQPEYRGKGTNVKW